MSCCIVHKLDQPTSEKPSQRGPLTRSLASPSPGGVVSTGENIDDTVPAMLRYGVITGITEFSIRKLANVVVNRPPYRVDLGRSPAMGRFNRKNIQVIDELGRTIEPWRSTRPYTRPPDLYIAQSSEIPSHHLTAHGSHHPELAVTNAHRQAPVRPSWQGGDLQAKHCLGRAVPMAGQVQSARHYTPENTHRTRKPTSATCEAESPAWVVRAGSGDHSSSFATVPQCRHEPRPKMATLLRGPN